MHIRTGTIVISTALLNGSSFEKTVIVIAEHNEKGSLGFIINQPFARSLNELEEFKDAINNNTQTVVSEIDGLKAMDVAHQILAKIGNASIAG